MAWRAVRALSARLIGADNDEIAFVKNTSHGISIVTSGLDWRKGDNVVVFEKEFPSNIYPWLDLKRKGVEVRFIPHKGDRIGLSTPAASATIGATTTITSVVTM